MKDKTEAIIDVLLSIKEFKDRLDPNNDDHKIILLLDGKQQGGVEIGGPLKFVVELLRENNKSIRNKEKILDDEFTKLEDLISDDKINEIKQKIIIKKIIKKMIQKIGPYDEQLSTFIITKLAEKKSFLSFGTDYSILKINTNFSNDPTFSGDLMYYDYMAANYIDSVRKNESDENNKKKIFNAFRPLIGDEKIKFKKYITYSLAKLANTFAEPDLFKEMNFNISQKDRVEKIINVSDCDRLLSDINEISLKNSEYTGDNNNNKKIDVVWNDYYGRIFSTINKANDFYMCEYADDFELSYKIENGIDDLYRSTLLLIQSMVTNYNISNITITNLVEEINKKVFPNADYDYDEKNNRKIGEKIRKKIISLSDLRHDKKIEIEKNINNYLNGNQYSDTDTVDDVVEKYKSAQYILDSVGSTMSVNIPITNYKTNLIERYYHAENKSLSETYSTIVRNLTTRKPDDFQTNCSSNFLYKNAIEPIVTLNYGSMPMDKILNWLVISAKKNITPPEQEINFSFDHVLNSSDFNDQGVFNETVTTGTIQTDSKLLYGSLVIVLAHDNKNTIYPTISFASTSGSEIRYDVYTSLVIDSAVLSKSGPTPDPVYYTANSKFLIFYRKQV
jgi:hypothetical protein